jgi:hypothetical protein
MKEQRQFLQHVQQLDLFLSLLLFSSFKGVPSTIERILFKEKEALELLFVRLLQE